MAKEKLFGWAFMVMMMAMSFSACSEGAEEVPAQETEIKLDCKVRFDDEVITSRVNSLDYQTTQIVEGQHVGVTIAGAKSAHNNVAWKVGKNGALTNTGEAVYYGADSATITAYHPYHSAWTGTRHEFSVSTDQTSEANYRNSDLFWTKTATLKTDAVVSLIFTHKLAKINITLASEEEGMNLDGATISICNTKVGTVFNPATGELTGTTGEVHEIIAGVTSSEAKTASALVVPQTVSAGSQFIKIALGENIRYYTLPADKVLKSGYAHNYKLIVKEQKVEVKTGSEINDWNGDDNTGDAEEDNK